MNINLPLWDSALAGFESKNNKCNLLGSNAKKYLFGIATASFFLKWKNRLKVNEKVLNLFHTIPLDFYSDFSFSDCKSIPGAFLVPHLEKQCSENKLKAVNTAAICEYHHCILRLPQSVDLIQGTEKGFVYFNVALFENCLLFSFL